MSVDAKQLYQGQPGTGSGTLFTVGSAQLAKVTEIIVANTTASAATVTIGYVPVGGTMGVTHHVLSAVSVPANDTIVVSSSTILDPGGSIQGLQGTAGAVTVTVSGEVRTP